MSYRNRKWIVCLQDDGMLKAMNGWYYVCDSDGGIQLGYYPEKHLADEIAKRLNGDEIEETEAKVREFACKIVEHTPLGYITEHEHKITENLVGRLVLRLLNEPLDFKFHED